MLTSNGHVLDESPRRLGELQPVPRHERTDRDRLWRRMRKDGYLFLSGHLDPAMVNAFRAYYFESLRETGLVDPDAPAVEGRAGTSEVDTRLMRRILFDRIVPGAEYARMCRLPDIAGLLRWLLGDDVHLHKRKLIRHTRPGESGAGRATQAHYDLLYLRGGSDRVLSIWISLGDCPISRGGLIYLEDSSRWVLAEEREGRLVRPAASMTADLAGLAAQHDQRWLVTDYRAGDIVIHSAYIVHASLDNVDPDGIMRLSTDIRYQRSGEPIDWRWREHWDDRDHWRWRIDQEPPADEAARLREAEPALLERHPGPTVANG